MTDTSNLSPVMFCDELKQQQGTSVFLCQKEQANITETSVLTLHTDGTHDNQEAGIKLCEAVFEYLPYRDVVVQGQHISRDSDTELDVKLQIANLSNH